MLVVAASRRRFIELGVLAATGVAARRARAVVPARLSIDPRDFGAVGDGVRDDRAPLQAAIDACAARGGGVVSIPQGMFGIGAIDADQGIWGLVLRSGVALRGAGEATVLRALPHGYGPGAYYRLIGSPRAAPLIDAAITDLVVDGNRTLQIASRQAGNILLECAEGVRVERVRSLAANGVAIMLRGSPQHAATKLAIRDCTVRDAADIGIQASQFDGCEISGNDIADTGDNGIDIYGDDGSIIAHARDFSIVRNHVRNASIGVFVETSRDGVVRDNMIEARAAGLAVNRIHGEPRFVMIRNNHVSAPIGVQVSGDTGGVRIEGNDFAKVADAGIQLGLGDGRVSRVEVIGNDFSFIGRNGILVRTDGGQASFITARDNRVHGKALVRNRLLRAARHVAVDLAPARAVP